MDNDEWVRLRAGAGELAVEEGRKKRQSRRDRVCRHCGSGEVEDVEHLLCGCEKRKMERRAMWQEVERGRGGGEKLARLLRGGTGSDAPAGC